MRLLNVHSLQFREFNSERNLRYVIASHRWSEDETSFKEVQEKRNISTAGYQKVKRFAAYIKDHIPAIEWLWIDTCCINKESAAELSESINSMFRWYLNAVVCLAHLPDVRTSEDINCIADSVWFTRGWTLQELIAPSIVVFLSRDWQVIGHKGSAVSHPEQAGLQIGRSVEAVVASRTGIPRAILRDSRRLQLSSSADRMRWAYGRETSREEDMSYCLFGLLEVSMPVIYGEGKTQANRRLLAALSDDSKADLDGLPVAAEATYDSFAERGFATCLKGTRIHLLEQIYDWSQGDDGKPIFWLCGKAGTGKSTIARTVAARFDTDVRCLGGTFFFKRGEADRGSARRFFPTVAKQLAQCISGLDHAVVEASKKGACEKNLSVQFKELILDPLSDADCIQTVRKTLILVIDALDECEDSTDAKLILKLLARATAIDPVRFRILVTSRPELPIQLGFGNMGGELHQDVMLEQVQETTIADDIRTYLVHRFREIKDEDALIGSFDPLPTDWPGDSSIEALVNIAVPLFIFASTICRFVAEADSQARLASILQHGGLSSSSGLGRTYLPVLDQAVRRRDSDEEAQALARFRELVGSIVLLAEPQCAQSLARLLQVAPREIGQRLRHLDSVLDIPGSSTIPIRLFHLSFRDFLVNVDGQQANRFQIDEPEAHKRLARQCLRLLSESGTLRKDICDVRKPGTRWTEVSRQRISASITTGVDYACCYWVWHLSKSGERLSNYDGVHSFLKLHFLHWLEALSWLGKLSWVVDYISDLQRLVDPDRGDQLLSFLQDAKRFMLYSPVVYVAPLQAYSSALVFAPAQSVVRRQFEHYIPGWLSLLPRVRSDWRLDVQRHEGHKSIVVAVAFSLDGKKVVSGSWDNTIRLWNAQTGEEMQKLEGHNDTVGAVAFSPDGTMVASGSWDNTVRLWNVMTGDELHKLIGHDGPVWAVAFSPDSKTLASGSGDRRVRLWSILTGEQTQKLEGHDDIVLPLAFSPDGQTIASGRSDKTVQLWNASTGEEIQRLQEVDDIHHLAFDQHGVFTYTGLDSLDDRSHVDSRQNGRKLNTPKLAVRDLWIQSDGEDVLWLPNEYRGDPVATYDSTLVIGTVLGAMLFFRIEVPN